MWYTISRGHSSIKITNNTVNPIEVTVFLQVSCTLNTFKAVYHLEQLEGSSTCLLQEDGVYKILLKDSNNVEATVIVNCFDTILMSLIKDIKNILCQCDCIDCDNCNETESSVSTVLLKILSYLILNSEKYQPYLIATSSCSSCSIIEDFKCLVINEKILGNSENMNLLKKVISTLYLTLYNADLKQGLSVDYIQSLYDFDNISKCLTLLNVDVQCVENNVNNIS